MPNGTYGGVRGRKTKVGRKLLRFPPTRLCDGLIVHVKQKLHAWLDFQTGREVVRDFLAVLLNRFWMERKWPSGKMSVRSEENSSPSRGKLESFPKGITVLSGKDFLFLPDQARRV